MNGLTPDITAAEIVRHGVLRLTFADGRSGEVEVLDRMRGPVFEDARTLEGFARVEADSETGTVVWPGGADLAPTRFMRGSSPGPGPSLVRPPDHYRFHSIAKARKGWFGLDPLTEPVTSCGHSAER